MSKEMLHVYRRVQKDAVKLEREEQRIAIKCILKGP